ARGLTRSPGRVPRRPQTSSGSDRGPPQPTSASRPAARRARAGPWKRDERGWGGTLDTGYLPRWAVTATCGLERATGPARRVLGGESGRTTFKISRSGGRTPEASAADFGGGNARSRLAVAARLKIADPALARPFAQFREV